MALPAAAAGGAEVAGAGVAGVAAGAALAGGAGVAAGGEADAAAEADAAGVAPCVVTFADPVGAVGAAAEEVPLTDEPPALTPTEPVAPAF
jgi:hypothetical protein